MEGLKRIFLVAMGVYVFLMPGCRLAQVRSKVGDYQYKGQTVVITADGRAYSKMKQDAIFKFSPEKVTYVYEVEGHTFSKDFEVSLSKVSFDNCHYYYSKEINNLFVLDERRRTLQVYGSNAEGKGRQSFSGHTFLDLTKIDI